LRHPTRTSLLPVLIGISVGCGPNQAPSKPEIDIEPAMPNTTDDLRLIITEPAVDPDADKLLYSTRWFQDGEIRPDVHGDVVPAERTVAGEYWIAELWATDGLLDSPVADATVYVFNTAPQATVQVRPHQPDTSSDLQAFVESSDLDGHPVELAYSWLVDGVASGRTTDTVPASVTAKGETWTVEVVPFDGDSWGLAASDQVSVVNSGPDTPVVGILPEQPRARRDPLQCALLDDVDDPDDDELSYRIEWRVDGVLFEDTTDTDLPGDTVPEGTTLAREHWECTLWADDGERQSRPGRASVEIGRGGAQDDADR
jgi:hypothetical protein